MKKTICSAILIFTTGGAFASEPVSALDSLNNSAGLTPAAGSLGSRWGDIPEPPPPTCVGDDCPGSGGGNWGGDDDGGQPANPSSGSGFNPATTFVATVCSNGECSNITGQQAAQKVSNFILKKYVNGVYEYAAPVRFEFPPMARNEIVKLLAKLEVQIVKEVHAQLLNDLKQIEPMAWDTQADKDRKEQVIKNDEKVIKKWKKAALKEAKTGINFSTLYSDSLKYWLFLPNNGGQAYSNLSDALQGKEWYR